MDPAEEGLLFYVQNYIGRDGCVFAENKLTRGETMMRKQNPGDQSVLYTKMDEPEKVKVVKLSPSQGRLDVFGGLKRKLVILFHI